MAEGELPTSFALQLSIPHSWCFKMVQHIASIGVLACSETAVVSDPATCLPPPSVAKG